jgi:hypothetical protein
VAGLINCREFVCNINRFLFIICLSIFKDEFVFIYKAILDKARAVAAAGAAAPDAHEVTR